VVVAARDRCPQDGETGALIAPVSHSLRTPAWIYFFFAVFFLVVDLLPQLLPQLIATHLLISTQSTTLIPRGAHDVNSFFRGRSPPTSLPTAARLPRAPFARAIVFGM
jgi:hypothetical protein